MARRDARILKWLASVVGVTMLGARYADSPIAIILGGPLTLATITGQFGNTIIGNSAIQWRRAWSRHSAQATLRSGAK